MGIDNYKDPIISQWESSGGVKYSKPIVNEPHVVVGGMFALIGLPDVQARVQISGMVEIGFKDKVVDAIQFKVDYTNGYVFVHTSKEGKTINASYSSRGVNMYPASRIYTKVNGSGDVVETMEGWMSNLNDAVGNETNRISNEVARVASELDRALKESDRVRSENNRIIFHDMMKQKLANGEFKGSKGDKGESGTSLSYKWNGTQLGIKSGTSGAYEYSQLKGERGFQGVQGVQGIKGDSGAQGVRGIQGIQGVKGDQGDKGDSGVSVHVDSNYYFSILNGDLILHYSDDAATAPNFSINSSGELIYIA